MKEGGLFSICVLLVLFVKAQAAVTYSALEGKFIGEAKEEKTKRVNVDSNRGRKTVTSDSNGLSSIDSQDLGRIKLSGCNQSMKYITANGDVTQKCINIIKVQSKVKRKDLIFLKKSLSDVSKDISMLTSQRSVDSAQLDENNKKIKELKKEYKIHKQEISLLSKDIHILEVSTAQSFNNISKELYSLNKFQTENEQLAHSIGLDLVEQGFEIAAMRVRIEVMQDDVDYMMKEFFAGNYKPVTFYGVKFDSFKLNDEKELNSLGIEVERLVDPSSVYSKFGISSILLEVSKVNGESLTTYQTLPGIEAEKIEKNLDFTNVGIGVKKIFDYRYNPYISGTIGKNFGDFDDMYTKLSFGSELYRKFHKLNLEVGYINFDDVEKTETDFNPLGESLITNSHDSVDGYFLSLKYLTRF